MKTCNFILVFGLLVTSNMIQAVANTSFQTRQQKSSVQHATLSLVGKLRADESLSVISSDKNLANFEKALAKSFLKTYPGGDDKQSYSKNGLYKAVKLSAPEYLKNTKSEEITIICALRDKDGKEIWRGKTFRKVFISNTGQNLVSINFWGDLHFYDINSTLPIKIYKIRDIRGAEFSENGKFFLLWGTNEIWLFHSNGDLIWQKKFVLSPGGAAISSQGSYVILCGKVMLERQHIKDKEDSKNNFEKDEIGLVDDFMKKELRVKVLENQRRYAEADSLWQSMNEVIPDRKHAAYGKQIKKDAIKIASSQTKGYITILDWQGNVLNELKVDLMINRYLHKIALSPDDGSYFAVSTSDKLFFFDTSSGKLIWQYDWHMKELATWISSLDVSEGGKYIAVSITHSPILGSTIKEKVRKYALLTRFGQKISELNIENVGEIAFSDDSSFIVSLTRKQNIYVIELK